MLADGADEGRSVALYILDRVGDTSVAAGSAWCIGLHRIYGLDGRSRFDADGACLVSLEIVKCSKARDEQDCRNQEGHKDGYK